MTKKITPSATKSALTRAQRQTAAATVNGMFVLKAAEEELRALPAGETIGEKGEKLAVRITGLTLAIEELNRVSDNLQRAIESF